MTLARYRHTAFEKGRPTPLVAEEPEASARLMLERPPAANLAKDLSRWVLTRSRHRPLEQSWENLRRTPRVLDEPRIRRR